MARCSITATAEIGSNMGQIISHPLAECFNFTGCSVESGKPMP